MKAETAVSVPHTKSDVKRALLLTNHLFAWAGTEIFALELGGELVRRGIQVSLFANDFDLAFAKTATASEGISLLTDPDEVRFGEIDFVYCQHQVLTLFLEKLLKAPALPFIAYGHLSPYEPIEAPGPCVQPGFGNMALCNSVETRDAMAELGLPQEELVVFPNPAPEVYYDLAAATGQLSRLLAVSNHFPEEMQEALLLVERQGVHVTRVGREFEARRIEPDDLAAHDAVVSIGKTVQYAVAARRPAFVYDRFAGPGWLTPDNFDRAADANFSGRCTPQTRTAADLAEEILGGHASASEAASRFDRDRFRLAKHVDRLLDSAKLGVHQPALEFAELQIAAMRREREQYKALTHYRSEARRPGEFEQAILAFGAKNALARGLLKIGSRVGPTSMRTSLRNACTKIDTLRKSNN